jgi:hypothetical protein
MSVLLLRKCDVGRKVGSFQTRCCIPSVFVFALCLQLAPLLHYAGDVHFARVRTADENALIGEKHYKQKQLQNPYLMEELSTDKRKSILEESKHIKGTMGSVAPVSGSKFLQYIETLNSGDDTAVKNDLFASQLLSNYRPKGRMALISPFLHVGLIICCVVPTLALFTLWGFKQFDYYYFAITQTTAFVFLIICFYL